MKRFIEVTLLFCQALSLISCSPVSFDKLPAQPPGGCSVASPCVGPNGTSTISQDFSFSQTNKVDILIVDDNSESMTAEQQSLAKSFNGLTDQLNAQGIDWQIGITNTDICSGADNALCLEKSGIVGAQGRLMGPLGVNPRYGNYIIRSTDTNAANVFSSTIQRQNEVGSGDERAIYAANLSLFGNAAGAGFIRDNSNLAVIILSDENERSVGGLCPAPFEPQPSNQYGNLFYSPQYPCDMSYAPLETLDGYQNFINTFATTYNGAKNLLVNSIIIKPDDYDSNGQPNLYYDPATGHQDTCLNVQRHQGPAFTAHYGSSYDSFAKATGGNSYSICDNGSGRFAQDVGTISGEIANLPASNVITLAHTALSVSLVQFTDNLNQSVQYSFSSPSNQITLATRPASGRTVRVTYIY